MGSNNQASLVDRAYTLLHKEILTCVMSPGQVVSERELADRYSMSKTPVREALTRICHEGLAQRLSGRGYIVAPITIQYIRDLFDLRVVLETAVVERAADQTSPELLLTLKQMATISYSLGDLESHTSFLTTNREFHVALAKAAGNRRLAGLLDGLLVEMDRLFYLGLRLRDSGEEMRQEHQEVVEALERGDAAGARGAIMRQVNASRDRILEAVMRGGDQSVQVGG